MHTLISVKYSMSNHPCLRWHISNGFGTDNDQKQCQLTEIVKPREKGGEGEGVRKIESKWRRLTGAFFVVFVQRGNEFQPQMNTLNSILIFLHFTWHTNRRISMNIEKFTHNSGAYCQSERYVLNFLTWNLIYMHSPTTPTTTM